MKGDRPMFPAVLSARHAKKKLPKAELGEPLYNLKMVVKCHQRFFEDSHIFSAQDQIEMVGDAISRAKKILAGLWHVTDKGYLIKGEILGLENHSAMFEVDISRTSLLNLEKVLDGKIDSDKVEDWPHVHADGAVLRLRVEKGTIRIF